MRTRTLTAVAVLAAASLGLAGCGSRDDGGGTDTGPTQGSVDLTVWFPGNLPEEMDLVNDTLVPAFQAEHPEANVTVEFVPWGDLSTRLSTAFAGGTVPDVFGHGVAATAGFADAGRLEPLDRYLDTLDAADRDDLVFLDSGMFDGKRYAMPLRGFGYLTAYRTDQAVEAGLDRDHPPTDWASLREWADKLVVRDGDRITRSGLIVPHGGGASIVQAFATFLAQAGGSLVSDDGSRITWNSPEGVEALEFVAGIYTGDNAVGTGVGEAIDTSGAQHPLCVGTAAMALISDETLASIATQAPECAAQLAVAQPLREKEKASFGGAGNVLFVSADSAEKDLAWEFVNFMVSPENSRAYIQAVGGIPARTSAAQDPQIARIDYLTPYLEAASFLRGNPNIPEWTQLRDVLAVAVEEAMRGVNDPRTALDATADEGTRILDEGSR